MDKIQIYSLMKSLSSEELTETHISYLIFSNKYAYKIKKPVKTDFLDFSTLSKRKFFCKQEVILNSRYSKNVYLNILSITSNNGEIIFSGKGRVIDYAVQMKRLDKNLDMLFLLSKNKISIFRIKNLARYIYKLHQNSKDIKRKFNKEKFKNKFKSLSVGLKTIETEFGKKYSDIIKRSIRFSNEFISSNLHTLEKRSINGSIKDCHGDLHSGNIFLYKRPVIFDCIEFDPALRQIDILDEIAFLCMDMESMDQKKLSDEFFKEYFRFSGKKPDQDEIKLFRYYKIYRAGVRAKINAIGIKTSKGKIKKYFRKETKKYLILIDQYLKSNKFFLTHKKSYNGTNRHDLKSNNNDED